MIHTLRGTITALEQSQIVLTLQEMGIGLVLTTPRPEQYHLNESLTMHTIVHWSPEQGPHLFGFRDPAERTLFTLLIGCQGIGPKLAITILSQRTVAEFAHLIMQNDCNALSSIKGVGAKKAEAILIHLRDKVTTLAPLTTPPGGNIAAPAEQAMTDVAQALSVLRYSTSEITRALSALRTEGIPSTATFDLLMRRALMHVARTAR